MTKPNYPLDLGELKKAVSRLREALAIEKSDIVRDSTIQRFEFTVELSWKALERFLRSEGTTATLSPKNIFREGARLGLVGDPSIWIEFVDARSLSSHTYREDLAEAVYAKARELPEFVDQLVAAIEGAK